MESFQLFIDDDRYSVPTLRLISAKDARAACEMAQQAVGESPHHLGAEVYSGATRLYGIGTLARRDPPAAGAEASAA